MGIIKNKHTDKHTGELEIVKSSLILFTVLLFFLLADYVSAAEFPYCLQKYSENGNGFWDGWLLLDNWATLPGNIGTQDHNSGGISPLLTIPGRGKKISATYDIKFATEDDFEPGPSGYGRRVGGGGHFASVISRSHNWCPEGTSCNDGRSCYDKWLRLELTSPTEEGYGISVRNHGPDYDQFCQSNSFGKVPGMRLRAGQWIRIRHEGEITGTNSARLTLQYISIDGTPLVGSQYTKVWNCNFVNPVPILHFYSFGNYDRGTQSGATYGDLQTRNLQFSVENSGEPPQSCSDGTPYNQCSSNKPRYCSNGNLISSCGPPNNCGCPSQQVCNQDGTCGAAQIPRCDQQGGICCTSGQTCNGNSVASNNCNTLCCVGTCQSPTQSILFEDDFESYSVGTTPSLWSSDQGTWTVEYETQGGNKVYKSYSTDAWLYSWPNNANFLNENNYEIIAKLNRWGGSASTGLGIIGYFNPSTGDGYIIRFRNVSPYTWIEKVDNFSTLTTISTYNFVPPSAAWFNVKAQFETLSDKTVIKLKVWNQGATEPVSWNLATNDTSRYSTQGTFGFAHRYNTEWYDDFEVSSIQQGSNRPPTATITLPTQTSFIINTQINYNGQGSDPENQPLTYTWTYDIIGDTSPEFPLPPGQSGTFIPTILVRNQSTLYTLKLVVRDTQGATGTAMKNLTINPIQGNNCAIINAYWDRKSAIVGDLVRLIAEGSNCNGMYVNFTIYEDDTSSGDDQVLINPQLVSFVNNRVEVTWIAEWQDDCGGLCNPPEYYFIVALRDNSNNRRQSATQLTVNRSLNQPPTAIINEPRINSELISFETNYPTKAVIDYGLTSNYGNRDSDDILFRSTHSILLRGLIKGETYHYRITVTDSNDRSLSTNDRIFTFLSDQQDQQCADGTPYNQCSSTKPLYCLSNGTLIPSCGSPYICGCPANLPTCITQIGMCVISENFPPTATITLPTQTSFIINTQINYNGQGSDPENQPLTYTWTYDIIGDTSPEFPLPPGQSGTFTPTILVRNQSTLYTLKLVVRDTQGATGTAMKNLTINPIQGNNCAIINAYWDRKSAIVGDLVRLIAEGSNCNGMYVNFTIYEDDTSSGDDQVRINPQLVSFANNRVEVTWVAEWQDDCGGLCNPPEYYFIVALRDNSNNRRQSATQLTVNRSLNQPPTAIINEPRMNSELISFETNYPTKAVIDYGLTSNYGNRDSDDILFRSTHSILLRGLIKGETYHYRITVTDSNDRSLSTNDRIFTFLSDQQDQQCADGTPYNQCSSTKPLYCLSNGTLIPSCGSPYICGCPANLPTCITQIGMCVISENFPPTATITLPTQTSFIINTQINYNGQGSDPENQPLTYTWTYDIIGDTSPEFPLPPGQSGTFTPTILVRNQSTIYTLKLVVRDTKGATGTAMKNLTINPGASSDLIISDITEKPVISFNLNSSIPFSGRGIDPDGELSGNQLVWSYDIIGDNQGIIRIGSGNSGSFIADKSTGELTIYKLFLNASDGKLSDIDFKEILIKLVNIPTDRRCSDGTPINQCSADMPLYCDNGNLVSRCGSPENCGCPDNQRCKRNGTCGGPNRLPRANLIEPTQNLFGNNASIGYLGNGTDEDQGNLISSELI